jgi:hypothetical protein
MMAIFILITLAAHNLVMFGHSRVASNPAKRAGHDQKDGMIARRLPGPAGFLHGTRSRRRLM